MPDQYIGVDTSKDELVIHVLPSNDMHRYSQTEEGIRKLEKDVAKIKPKLIVFEATGGYERKAAASLAAAELPVAVVNPRRIKDFAKAKGQLAKTDPIDAHIAAEFAMVIQPSPTEFPSDELYQLKELVARRRQLNQMLVSEKNRSSRSANQSVQKSLFTHIKYIENEINDTDKNLGNMISVSEDLTERKEIMESVPGIGSATAFLLLSELPELRQFDQ